MVRYLVSWSCALCIPFASAVIEPNHVIITPQFSCVSTSNNVHSIVLSALIFKKRQPENSYLKQLAITWHGPHLQSLYGSLFKKMGSKPFIPVEDNVVADTEWHEQTQTLRFHFNTALSLGAVTELYLVAQVPESELGRIQQGHFDIAHTALPRSFTKKLSLDGNRRVLHR